MTSPPRVLPSASHVDPPARSSGSYTPARPAGRPQLRHSPSSHATQQHTSQTAPAPDRQLGMATAPPVQCTCYTRLLRATTIPSSRATLPNHQLRHSRIRSTGRLPSKRPHDFLWWSRRSILRMTTVNPTTNTSTTNTVDSWNHKSASCNNRIGLHLIVRHAPTYVAYVTGHQAGNSGKSNISRRGLSLWYAPNSVIAFHAFRSRDRNFTNPSMGGGPGLSDGLLPMANMTDPV
mmetsp:Transcript_64853/g.173842  ORF Transcript_64853/g.173842 Transcript_64853/m.173842 type:complete len:234 (-) Transcript_64853:821-1522(-)